MAERVDRGGPRGAVTEEAVGGRGGGGRGWGCNEMDESCWGLKGASERVNLK